MSENNGRLQRREPVCLNTADRRRLHQISRRSKVTAYDNDRRLSLAPQISSDHRSSLIGCLQWWSKHETKTKQTYLKYTCTTCALSLLHVCFIVWTGHNGQFTPTTPTRLKSAQLRCWVESRRGCEQNWRRDTILLWATVADSWVASASSVWIGRKLVSDLR